MPLPYATGDGVIYDPAYVSITLRVLPGNRRELALEQSRVRGEPRHDGSRLYGRTYALDDVKGSTMLFNFELVLQSHEGSKRAKKLQQMREDVVKTVLLLKHDAEDKLSRFSDGAKVTAIVVPSSQADPSKRIIIRGLDRSLSREILEWLEYEVHWDRRIKIPDRAIGTWVGDDLHVDFDVRGLMTLDPQPKVPVARLGSVA